MGSPAATTRGFGTAEFKLVGEMILEILDGLAQNGLENNFAVETQINQKVKDICATYPIYSSN